MPTSQDEDVARMVAQALALPNLATASLGDEYSYNLGLPVCIIDTVFRLGACDRPLVQALHQTPWE